ncbi:MAG: response regulator transcription factor [Bryobacterales bacterium]|nr:response regulator transcription factor [Bryobacterales bacterium]
MIRVAIVEDDTPSREALSVLIEGAPGFRCVAASASLEHALPILPDAAPNVILLDLNLPGMHGVDGVKLLRERFPRAHVVILTVHSEQDRIFDCICNGAAGYLLKGAPPARLLDSIREACDGGVPMSPAIARKVIDVFRQLPPRPAALATLTPQEIRVLRLLAEGHGYIAIGSQLKISVNTVRNYIRSIYEKLHVHTKSEAVSKAIRAGLFR